MAAATSSGVTPRSVPSHSVTRYADMLAAIGAEPRLRIVRLLLSAHPTGMSAGDIGTALDIAPSTLSHHLDRLKREEVVKVRRKSTFLWYTANAEALEDLLQFLFAECCTRNGCVNADRFTDVKGGPEGPPLQKQTRVP